MRRERSKPTYDLNQAKWLARCGMLAINRRARRFIDNRYSGKPKDIVKELFEQIRPADFVKTLLLDRVPGTWADVYLVELGETAWYVKFYILEEKELELKVLSANWDGYIH